MGSEKDVVVNIAGSRTNMIKFCTRCMKIRIGTSARSVDIAVIAEVLGNDLDVTNTNHSVVAKDHVVRIFSCRKKFDAFSQLWCVGWLVMDIVIFGRDISDVAIADHVPVQTSPKRYKTQNGVVDVRQVV